MPKKILILAVLLVCYYFIAFPFSSYSRVAQIRDLFINRDTENILVYAMVTDCFTGKMEEAIMAGAPTMFTFLIDLYEERPYWCDRKLSAIVIKHTIKYDTAKKTFFVSANGGHEPAGFQDLESAKRAMAELNGVAVAPVGILQRDKTYYIRIKAKLDKIRLPMHMEYVFFFVSLWDFETDWIEKTLLFNYGQGS
ncbi:MAG: DUF4390 domain-containing protein [Deltaproteobacteria bacterium]|nr:DUF4390 domain-containing protein [Deltaproteobacteria bacterium]